MRALRLWWPRDRRQAQSGATLVELLVSVVIIGLALALIIGTFSTGLLDATYAKRDTAAVAVTQYELEAISGSAYNVSAQSYSDCFATEDVNTPPTTIASFKGMCPGSTFTLRADVTVAAGTIANTQLWSISVVSWPAVGTVGSAVQLIKDNR